jgi:hypothetical protein
MSEMTHDPCGAAFEILNAFDVVTFARYHDGECQASPGKRAARHPEASSWRSEV